MNKEERVDKDLGLSVGTSLNSRGGFKSITLGVDISTKEKGHRTKSESLFDTHFSFAKPTYTPSQQLSFWNYSLSFSGKFGVEACHFPYLANLTGYFSGQKLGVKSMSSKAYGTFYAQKGAGKRRALHDFNREKDGAFDKNTPNLPLTVPTQDIYSVAGQGVAGGSQLKRGDVGMFYDPKVNSFSGGASLGLEFGLGSGTYAGINEQVNASITSSGLWQNDNDAIALLDFQSSNGNNNYEPAYFKVAGEKSVESDPDFYKQIGKTEAVRVPLEDLGGLEAKAKKDLIDKNGASIYSANNVPSKLVRSKRERRSQVISSLSAEQADQFGLQKHLLNFPLNDFSAAPDMIIRTSGGREKHHLSELTVLRTDGVRYIYGIPAYNLEQREVTFAIDKPSGFPCSSGTITYAPGIDNSENNQQGVDHYFSREITKGYAHSYLMTAVSHQTMLILLATAHA